MVRTAGNVLSSPDSSPHLEESSVISPLMSSSSCAEVFMPQSFTFLLQQIPSREARVSSCFNFFSLLLAPESYCLGSRYFFTCSSLSAYCASDPWLVRSIAVNHCSDGACGVRLHQRSSVLHGSSYVQLRILCACVQNVFPCAKWGPLRIARPYALRVFCV